MNRNLKQLEQELQIRFQHRDILRQAFTHSSYVNENRPDVLKDNERLEFLGDAVLELTVSEFLFQAYPDWSEGELTRQRAKIVCEPSLVVFAEKLQFGDYVLLGRGEEQTGGRSRPALLADVFEAFVGALFLDQGIDAVKAFLQHHLFPYLDEPGGKQSVVDYKSELQEHTQQHGLGSIEYRIVDERGPAHEREFISEVWLRDKLLGTGSGRSKKEAEQQAASQALGQLNEKE